MNELIKQMATDSASMSLSEKMLGGLAVTLFSMAIVFLVLVLIMYAIKAMTSSVSKVAARREAKVVNETAEEVKIQETPLEIESNNEEEVVVAIMAALNSYYASNQSKIVIKNISKKEDSTWVNAGILNQINSRL